MGTILRRGSANCPIYGAQASGLRPENSAVKTHLHQTALERHYENRPTPSGGALRSSGYFLRSPLGSHKTSQ